MLPLLATMKRVASRNNWNVVIAVMGTLVLIAVILRTAIWNQEYSVFDGRVLLLLGFTSVAIMGRLVRGWRRKSMDS